MCVGIFFTRSPWRQMRHRRRRQLEQQKQQQQLQRQHGVQDQADSAARTFILWLHGLGDNGPNNEPIQMFFTEPEFQTTEWSFPTAPSVPVTCNSGAVMPSWFDIFEMPIAAESSKDEKGLLKSIESVHAIIDEQIMKGVCPEDIFVCGLSQGGALTLASVLLYPQTLGGSAVLSGWIPFSSKIEKFITPEAKKTPLLWIHGVPDQTVLFEAGQAGHRFLQQVGLDCEFKDYPNLGHSISEEEMTYLQLWIKAHVKSSTQISSTNSLVKL